MNDAPKTEAQEAADAIIRQYGAQGSGDILREMLALAYARGASAGITEAVESFDRVLSKHTSA